MPEIFKEMLRAMWWGTFAGAAPILLFTFPIGIIMFVGGEPGGLAVAVYPLIFAGMFVVPVFLFVGLAATKALQLLGKEERGNYVAAGLIAGMAAPFILFAFYAGLTGIFEAFSAAAFLAFFGAIGGSVSGHVWGTWREAEAANSAEALNEAFE